MNLLPRDNSEPAKQHVTSQMYRASLERTTRPHLSARYLNDAASISVRSDQ